MNKQYCLQQALANADQAVKLAPDDSSAHAVRAFVLDWIASVPPPLVTAEQKQEWLYDAEKEATKAFTLDETNSLALAYYAEILVDQGKLLQAEQKIGQALEKGGDLMDVRRVNGYVLEYMGAYNASLEEYVKASEITPNLTFLYIDIGNKYRYQANMSISEAQKKGLYEDALRYFEKAVVINAQLGIKDPVPYVAIANTYAQMGEFFSAVLNMRKALELNPGSAQVYAQLGMVYHRSRNYEGSIPAFKCALEGCTPQESCAVRPDCNADTDPPITIKSLPLDQDTWIYYTTYGSVLAGLHKPSRPYCQDSVRILAMVRAQFGNDPEIMEIVKPSEDICASAGYSVQPQSPSQTGTETPTGVVTDIPPATPAEPTVQIPAQP